MSCCKGKSVLPPKREQVSNLVLSVANILSNAIRSGKILADKDVVSKRIEICKNCRHLTDTNRCTVCGCFVNKKAGIKVEKCPLNLW